MRIVLLLLALAAILPAAQRSQPTAPESNELRLVLAERGEVLLNEAFAPGEWEARWGRTAKGWQAGEWAAVEGGIQGKPIAAENHHPALPHRVEMTDVALQVSFRFDGADSIFIGFDGKEHIARCFITPDKLRITKTTGIGSTTKSETIDEMPLRLERGRWYCVVIELVGTRMMARIGDGSIVYGEIDGIEIPKNRFELMCHGGDSSASFGQVKLWRAALHPDWDKRQALVARALEKRKP